MSRLGLSINKNSRNSQRGIVYSSIMKNSTPNYGIASNKQTYQDNNKVMKSHIGTNQHSKIYKEQKYNNYDHLLNNWEPKLSDKGSTENQLKRQGRDRNKEFRIRTNTKEKQTNFNMKSSKDEENDDKYELMRIGEKETSKINSQHKKYTTNSTSSSKYNTNIGLVGLNNIGNTCFMNSILQCVFNLPKFNDYFLQDLHLNQIKSSSKVASAYARTIKLIRSSSSRSQTPSQLKNAIGSKKARFLGYSQQDAQQFLAALLELLSQDLNRSSKPKYRELTADTSKNTLEQISQQWWRYNKQRQDSVVCDYFSGQILSRVVCSKCRHQSIAFDNIWDMALNFSSGDGGKLKKMIQNFLKEETISNDYYCTKCKTFRECKRKIDFYRLPQILVFQIKRFSYGRWRKVKLNNYVKVEETLDLTPFVTESKHKSTRNPIYELVGVVNHSGDIDFGHYTAECKNPINGKWYNFNDSHVSETRMRESYESASPYLLFYTRQ